MRVQRGAAAFAFHRLPHGSTGDIRIALEPESSLTYVLISNGSNACMRATLARHASIHWHIFTFGSGEYDLQSELTGQDATSQIDWLFRTMKDEKQSIDARNIFRAKNGGGEMVLKGIAEDRSSVKVRGMIEIGEQGSGAKTHLTEEMLMLDPTAKIDAIPGLEIKTNDVKASHSATVSRVTPEQLFYLQSRGLPESIARRLFIDGFMQEMIHQVPESVREKVAEMIV